MDNGVRPIHRSTLRSSGKEKKAMPIGAGIRLFGVPCQTRHELSEGVRLAIERVYSLQTTLDRATRTHGDIDQAAALLHSARQDSLAAQRLYDAHLREHGCMGEPKSRAAHA